MSVLKILSRLVNQWSPTPLIAGDQILNLKYQHILSLLIFVMMLCMSTTYVYADGFNDFSELTKDTKKVTLKFRDTIDPTNGVELNRTFAELDGDFAFSYAATSKASITKLIKILNKSIVKEPSLENSQLMYVNLLVTFELNDKTSAYLLAGKYYEADPTIEAELHNNKTQIKTIALNKMVHKALRDWILQYAHIDKETIAKKFKHYCHKYYSNQILGEEEHEIYMNKAYLEAYGKASAQNYSNADRINKFKQLLAKCNDSDNPDYQNTLKYHRDWMLTNFFKNDASQICDMNPVYYKSMGSRLDPPMNQPGDKHDLYHTDPNYCGHSEWQPSYNQWNENNLRETRK